MCSFLGCGSLRRRAQLFKLPEDPEMRLEWVQFLFEANKQRLKESCWTEITICNEHFTDDCFEHLTTAADTVQLKPSAVPSVSVKSEPDELLENPHYVKPVDSRGTAPQSGDLNDPTLKSPDVSNAVCTGSHQIQYKVRNVDLNNEEAGLLQVKAKHVVNESCLFQLFRRKCPSCGCKLQTEKVTSGVLIILNQQCLQCDYGYQWKSQVNASVPTAEDQPLTEVVDVTPETQQKMSTDDNASSTVLSEIVTFSDEESDLSDEGEEGDEGGVSSDGEWKPTEDFLLSEKLTKEFEEETERESGEEHVFYSLGGLKINELCTECGHFFTIPKSHTCEHKKKPYSCNICGKRCITELSLKCHSRIHDETYDHPCKYCHVTFKTKVDKLKHEQTHQDSKDPYKCPDCPETFSNNKRRRIHLAKHRSKESRCGVCGIKFRNVHHLRRHSVVHTGLKPYKCSECERSFNQAGHLKSHMRVHTGERPFKCPQCDKSFNHNVSLRSHFQSYHLSNSGRGRNKGKLTETVSTTGDPDDSRNKRGTDFRCVEEEEEDTEEEMKIARKNAQKRTNTGSPKQMPKRHSAGNLVVAGGKKGKRSNS
ncbi:zinc finger protein with KRAB and SCAN domains 7-like [Eleginops maclovinus]|uniref:zinc finger protein with KRAB and SCAN domains 7-like n=1 Tax=Eleginops maclovinus TaxID=56733 RepID=UPI00308022D1